MIDYDAFRHFADTYGLAAMGVMFVVLCLWPFLPGNRAANRNAARSIFEGHDDGE